MLLLAPACCLPCCSYYTCMCAEGLPPPCTCACDVCPGRHGFCQHSGPGLDWRCIALRQKVCGCSRRTAGAKCLVGLPLQMRDHICLLLLRTAYALLQYAGYCSK